MCVYKSEAKNGEAKWEDGLEYIQNGLMFVFMNVHVSYGPYVIDIMDMVYDLFDRKDVERN